MSDQDDSSDFESAKPLNLKQRKRKILMRIEFDSSSSSDSDNGDEIRLAGSSGTANSSRGRKKAPAKVDGCLTEFSDNSVWENDWISDPEASKTERLDNNNADDNSSNDGSEKCPICLFSFLEQEIGRPAICDHKFCATCIDEWSRNVSTCPIDRLEFKTIVCTENFDNGRVTREIQVETGKNSLNDIEITTAADLTHCDVCRRSDREETMLLCDGCNHGFHIECLSPPLNQIPVGFWYCDDCYDSEEGEEEDGPNATSMQEEIAELLVEMRGCGIPESRLRIRTETVTDTPRITRTRQSERIRSAILARTNRRRFREMEQNNSVVVVEDDEPGPSCSQQRVTLRARAKKQSPKKQMRKSTRRKRAQTVVVEYDVGNDDDKFAMKTKKIYKKIKRRRRKKRKTVKRTACEKSRQSTRRRNGVELTNEITKDELSVRRMQAGIPNLSLFGSANQLEYFSSNDEEEDGGAEDDSGIGSGLVTASRRPLNFTRNLRNLRNQKGGLVIPETCMSSSADLLSSIMDEQERWFHISNRTNIGNIKIKPDGSLEYKQPGRDGGAARPDRRDMQSAPLNTSSAEKSSVSGKEGTNDNGGSSSSGRNPSNSVISRGGGSTGASSTNNKSGLSNAGGDSGGVSGNNLNFPSRISFSKSPKKVENNNQNKVAINQQTGPQLYDGEDLPNVKKRDDKKETLNNGQSQEKNDNGPAAAPTLSESQPSATPAIDPHNLSSDDDCPNFSVYSAETMKLAKNLSDSEEEVKQPDEEEKEEDLVQMDDDDEEPVPPSDQSENVEPTEEKSKEPSPEKTEAVNGTSKKCVLELYDDSDWEEWTNEKTDEDKPAEKVPRINSTKESSNTKTKEDSKGEIENQLNTETISEEENEPEEDARSFTPCLDENQPVDEEDPNKSAKSDKTDDGIIGLETELISDDEIPAATESKEAAEKKAMKPAVSGTPSGKTETSTKKDKDDSKKEDEFKKVSKNNKGRNYRDKDRSRSRSRGRNHSKEKTGIPEKNKRNRRKDLQRYDVRNLIADRKVKPIKDKYGRDTTRGRKSKSGSRSCSLSSLSPRKSNTRSRSRSGGGHRRSVSPRGRLRPRKTRSRSPRNRRFSPRRSSKSPRRRRTRSRSPTNRKKRSLSRFTMSPSLSRSPSPRNSRNARRRDPSNKRTVLPKEKDRKSLNNGRSVDKIKAKLPSSIERSLSPSGGVGKKRKAHRPRSVNRKRNRTRSISLSPEKKSPIRAIPRKLVEEYDKSWTPPIENHPSSPDRLKVVLKNSKPVGLSGKSGKKKEKRKKGEKSGRRESGDASGRREKRSRKRTTSQAAPPSKEVFASGDNIVVNLNFSKNAETNKPQQTTIVTLPPSKDQIITQKRRNERREMLSDKRGSNKSSLSKHPMGTTLIVTKRRRHRKVDTKPVAIIDLDRSPFKEITPSPKAVIVLSDSDHDSGERTKKKNEVGSYSNNNNKIGEIIEIDGDQLSKKKSSSTANKDSKQQSTPQTEADLTLLSNENDSSFEMDLLESLDPNTSSTSIKNQSNNPNNSTMSANLSSLSGPKTPPEPLLKFSMAVKAKNPLLRSVNPLHDDEPEEPEDPTATATTSVNTSLPEFAYATSISGGNNNSSSCGGDSVGAGGVDSNKGGCDSDSNVDLNVNTTSSSSTNVMAKVISSGGTSSLNKIGPNTPPEPAPSSPDAYDPFEPTKSNSQSPSQKEMAMDTDSTANTSKASVMHPKELVMKLTEQLEVPHSSMMTAAQKQSPTPEKLEQTPSKSSSITILSNVVIQAGKVPTSSDLPPVPTPTSMSSTLYVASNPTTFSILKQQSSVAKNLYKSTTSTTLTSALASATTTTAVPTLTRAMLKRHNAEQTMMTELAESPYSPGSSDFDDLFEPPAEMTRQSGQQRLGFSGSRVSPKKAAQQPASGNKNQAELFDSLFGSSSPPQMGGQSWNPGKIKKQGHHHGESRSHRRSSSHLKDDSLDVPNSASDLLVKDRILKKIHRQERVVEEVKLVLKPHFNKKRITKDDYKEILRKSVPKVCHSRTGEINPAKIKALIDAYVKKYRYKRKHMSDGQANNSVSTANATSLANNPSSSSMISMMMIGNSGLIPTSSNQKNSTQSSSGGNNTNPIREW